jgi:long-chain fatty acid transport protein
VLGVWVAWKPLPEWSFGIGVEALVGRFVATTMYGACVPERFFCAPEQPEWDALTELDAAPIVAPSGNLGVKWTPHRSWRLGAAFQLPWWVRAPATVRTRLPATPAFESASQEGDSADIGFELPWALRLGVEFRPIDAVAIELDGSMEGWAIHDEIVVSPDDLALRNVVGFPDPFRVPSQSIPRNFQNSYSARLGAEFGGPVSNVTLTGRAGFSYESSAIPPEWMSVLTVDMQKLTLALGGSVGYEAWRFDVVYAHVFGLDVDVDAATAMSPQLSPVKANVSEVHAVNGGTYSARADVVGIGMKYSFDHPADEEPPKKKK